MLAGRELLHWNIIREATQAPARGCLIKSMMFGADSMIEDRLSEFQGEVVALLDSVSRSLEGNAVVRRADLGDPVSGLLQYSFEPTRSGPAPFCFDVGHDIVYMLVGRATVVEFLASAEGDTKVLNDVHDWINAIVAGDFREVVMEHPASGFTVSELKLTVGGHERHVLGNRVLPWFLLDPRHRRQTLNYTPYRPSEG